MHSKSSFTYSRLVVLALIGVTAIVVALAFGLPRSGAAPAGQSKSSVAKKDQSRRAGRRHDSKVDAFLSQPSVRSSLDEIKLTDPAGEWLDFYGSQVAISDTTAVVGTSAVWNISEQGKVHIFVRRDDVWELQQTVVFDARLPENHQDVVGFPLAIDKDTLVICVYRAVYVYVRTGTTWSLQTTFLAPVPDGPPTYGESFGVSVAVSGDTVIVGASWEDDYAGAVYFYERNGETWSEPVKLSANDHSPDDFGQPFGDFFGHRVAIEGDTAVVAAGNQDVVEDEIDDMEGAAYVYVRNLGTWVEQGYLTPPAEVIETTVDMGTSVDISGDTVVIGASLQEHAFVYVRQGTSWTDQQVLTAVDGHTQDFFGRSVRISGDRIVVGSPRNAHNLGAAYLFERTGTTWFEGDKLRSTTGVPSNEGNLFFGSVVDISGETIIAGAPNEKIEENDLQGAAYIFQKLDSDGDALADDWEEEGITVAENGRVVGTGNLEGEGTFIDLPKMGADPMHKDIFIHVDWMEPDSDDDFEPKPRAIGMVIDAFANAPVTNPDSKPGINLHVDFGPDSVMKYVDGEAETWDDLSEAGEVPFQEVFDTATPPTSASYDAALLPFKEEHFNPAHRNAVFHYVLYCKKINEEKPGGLGSFRGTDFLLAFSNQKKVINQAGSFMHELGHNLGLDHGGDDDVNYKPNYISVMNYRFNSLGTLRPNGRQRYIDFSREELDTLDETELDENVGINDTAGHVTTWSIWTRPDDPPHSNKCVGNPDFFYRLFYPSAALDWNCDGVRSTMPITPDPIWGGTDLNSDGRCVAASRAPDGSFVLHTTPAPGDVVIGPFVTSGSNRVCETTASGGDRQLQPVNFEEPELLEGFDDWEALVFDGENKIGRLSGTPATRNLRGSSVQTSIVPHELSLEEIEAELPPGLVNEELIAPVDVVTQSLHSGAAPLPVYFDGSASTAVNGTIVDWQWDFGDGTTGSGATVTHTYTVLGDYFATLTVTDNNGHVNLVPLLNRVTVTSLHPNLVPFQPPGWSDKIVVSTVTGTNTDSAELTTNNTLYIDSAVINNGTGPTTAGFVTKLYVDGVEAQTFLTSPPLSTNSITAVQDLAVGPLSSGQHTLLIVADVNGAIAETDESDNEYSRVINITGPDPTPSPTPTGQPNLTPFQPPGWSDRIVVSNVTGTNADGATLNTTDTLYVDWAAINNGGGPTTGSFETKLYVDGVERNTRITSQTINPGGSFGVQDITIGSLGAGQHSVRIVLDTAGVIVEGNETDNEYIKTISVLSPLPSPSPTPTPTPVSQTYTVGNTNDSGPGSLRQAFIDANNHPNGAGGIDQIVFNIPGAGVHTITPTSAFPVISDAVLIDGYTQPGTSPNTLPVGDNAVLLIELDGTNLNFEGLELTGGNSTIRGLVINHFDRNPIGNIAIRLASSNNVISGNFIGTNPSGTAAVRNAFCVTIASGANNLVGGTTPADRNIIGGGAIQTEPAAGAGLQILTTQPGTRVLGNYIGTNAAGTAALGNGRGIDLVGSPSADITIGGLTDTPGTGAGNVISGNSSNGGINSYGIYVANRPGDLRIRGNLIGLNATGTTAVSNGVSGIHFADTIPGTSLLLVGGTEPGARNVIFNNRITGILSNAIGLIVQGNFIGTDITGTVKPPLAMGSSSGGDGITIGGGSVMIGGDTAAARNVISCLGRGLRLASGLTTLQGNYIGTTVDGSTSLGNQPAGVRVENDAIAIIGGTGPGQGNVIAHSYTGGIEVRNTARATILGNSIFDNGTQDLSTFQGHPGIDLNDNGVTPNDSCDEDNGPNGLQNFPILTSAVASAGAIKFVGSLNSKTATSFRIEFLANPSCEASGHGEGQTYVGWTTISTGESCSAAINVTLPAAVAVGQFISATATDADGNTSEFGPCVQVTAAAPTAASGTVSGKIADTHGNSVGGVAVSLTGTQSRLAITDENGLYNFDNVETNGFYTVIPSRANFSFSPAQRSFSLSGIGTDAPFTATSNAAETGNPLDMPEFFVRQQYLDFLSREPDPDGFNYWVDMISECLDASCQRAKRIDVSNAFFREQEFQESAGYVYRIYKAALGERPKFAQFQPDRQLVVGAKDLDQRKSAFALVFVQRDNFVSAYPRSQTGDQFVDAIANTIKSSSGVDLAFRRAELLALFDGTDNGRAKILRQLADDQSLVASEYNRLFVLTQYFGYLGRDPDQFGFEFWLGQVNSAPLGDTTKQHAMVCSFISSTEYQLRFSSVVTHSNAECH